MSDMTAADGAAARPAAAAEALEEPPRSTRLRLLSYNIQAGAAASRFRHYVTHSWKHVLPHSACLQNLDSIGAIVRDYDVVGLQEVDAGSLRSYFINQVEYLSQRADFPYWYHQTNRNLGKLAQYSNGLLSRMTPTEVIDYRLPGVIPGRGAIFLRFGSKKEPLVVLLVHLALSRRARLKQLAFLIELVNEYPHVVTMGDFNCELHSREIQTLLANTRLAAPLEEGLSTFPSWRPFRNIDHILVTPSLKASNARVLHYTYSDHLPIALDIQVPASVEVKPQQGRTAVQVREVTRASS